MHELIAGLSTIGIMAFFAILRIVMLLENIRHSLDLIEVRTKPGFWNQP